MQLKRLLTIVAETGAQIVTLSAADYETLMSDPDMAQYQTVPKTAPRAAPHRGQGVAGNLIVVEHGLVGPDLDVVVRVVSQPPFDPKNTERNYSKRAAGHAHH